MTPAELKTLVLGLPSEHTARVAFVAAEDVACAAALSALTVPGPVPIREVSSYCLINQIIGGALALDSIPLGGTIAEGVTMTLQIKGMLKSLMALMSDAYRLETCDVTHPAFAATCDGLIQLGVMTSGNKSDLLAMAANRLAIAAVTPAEVEAARNS